MHDYKALGIQDEVYAIQFSSGVVKVGRTQDFGRRLAEHTKTAAARDESVTGEWHTFVDDSLTAEQRLIATAKALGGVALPRKYEWFAGTDFDALVERATAEYGDYDTWLHEQDVLLVQSMDSWFPKV